MVLVATPADISILEVEPWRLRTMTPTAGPGLDGRQQWIHRENRAWMCVYKARGAWGTKHDDFLAFLDELRGPSGTFRLPVLNTNVPDIGVSSVFFLMDDAAENFLVSDGGSDFLVWLGSDPTLAIAAPVGARIVQLVGGEALRPGLKFSYNDFLYRITAVDGESVTINPPLREAIAMGEPVALKAPYIRVRLVDDEAAENAYKFDVQGGKFTLRIMEAFER